MHQFFMGKHQVFIICIAAVLLNNGPCQAQNITVIKKTKIYRQLVINDTAQRMVRLPEILNKAQYDLRYAREDNFTGKQLYTKNAAAWLRLAPAKALLQVEQELRLQGFGLKIFDAYRPYEVTKKMWKLIGDERYVANPAKGSGHNRGLAIDLTLYRLDTGLEVPMGTGFDHFTDSAHHGFAGLPTRILVNRLLLRRTMEKAGFRALETEWWHYSWPNDRNYAVLDIPFGKM